MNVVFYQNQYQTVWDEFVNNSDQGTFYHLSGWKNVLEKTFGFQSLYLMALNSPGEIQGILPLFLMKDIFGRKYLISTPFSNYSGICAVDEHATSALFQKAQALAVEYHVQYVEFRQFDHEVSELPTKKDFVTMLIDLKNGQEHLWKKSFKKSVRETIGRAARKGITADVGRHYLSDFYQTFSQCVKDLGTPIFPLRFFKNILETFPDSTEITVVKYQNKVIGGVISIVYKKMFIIPWGSTIDQYYHLNPSTLMFWETIKLAYHSRCECFDFGRSTMDSGTFHFKKHWGAVPVQLNYQYYLHKARNIPVVNAFHGKYDLAIRLWKKLPLSFANVLGPRVVKYLPEL
jgi:serine/alanine adding enzyme